MNARNTNEIMNILIKKAVDHIVLDNGSAGQEGQLSLFKCICGQEFVPNEMVSSKRDWASLPLVHKAMMSAEALGVLTDDHNDDNVENAPAGSVFVGSDRLLYRKYSTTEWLGQNGEYHRNISPKSKSMTLLWSPEERNED